MNGGADGALDLERTMALTIEMAKELVGKMGAVVQVIGSDDITAFGKVEKVTPDGWVGIRGPFNRYDEYQPSQLELSPT